MRFDVAIIGSGPGGYVSAVRCSQLGMKVALIEKYPNLGGTCLNVGCIPSKALLDSTEHFHNAEHNFGHHGIKVEGVSIDLEKMISRKEEVVRSNSEGVRYLMKKHKVEVLEGVGSFISKDKILVTQNDGTKKEIEAGKIIIATGSKPASLPGITIDKKRIISSTEALNIRKMPKEMVVIGGGIIGCEMGSVFARMGVKVTIVEYADRLIPGMDSELGKELLKVLKKLGIVFYLSTKVTQVTATARQATVKAEQKNGEEITIKGDYCLMAVGRRPYTEGLNLAAVGLETDAAGRIVVDENLETPVKGIYAIGDVVRGPMLAHKAEEEGVFVAEIIAGQKPHIDYNLIPGVVYTWPEVAGTGQTEDQLSQNGIAYKKGVFPFKASGRARASMDLDGFIKVLADKTTDEILGVHMIGPRVADLIGEAVVAMEYRASAEDIGRISHAHPTFSEAIKEACLAATDNRPLNL